MTVLEYKTWENFHDVIKKSRIVLEKIYPQSEDHFREVTKMIKIAKGTGKETTRKIIDYELTRRDCY